MGIRQGLAPPFTLWAQSTLQALKLCYFLAMKKYTHRYSFILLALLLLSACGGGSGDTAGGNSTAASKPSLSDSGEVVSTGTYNQIGNTWRYQNLRLPNKTGGFAYATYYQANGAGPHPVIVMTQPYDGINWTGEAVDNRWAAEYNTYVAAGGIPPMCAPDVDGPNYNSKTSSTTCYTLPSNAQTGDQAFIYLWNNFSVLMTYGRFYAGGSVANDIEDTVAGLRFLGTRGEIDQAQIGIVGGSWGGFEALYASLNAPANVRPAVAAPFAPVSDFFGLVNFVNTDLPNLVSAPVLKKYNQFYNPYLRRFFASTGKAPNTNYSGYTLNDLSALVSSTAMLILHDDGDTILPAKFSHNFASANPARVEGFWYKRLDAAPWETVVTEHGQIGNFITIPAYRTFSTLYLFGKLNNAGQSPLYIPYGKQDMQTFFNNIHTYQLAARDVSWLAPRLIEMCDPAISMYELTAGNLAPITSGANYIAQSLNVVWGTTLTATTVKQYLINNGLPPK